MPPQHRFRHKECLSFAVRWPGGDSSGRPDHYGVTIVDPFLRLVEPVAIRRVLGQVGALQRGGGPYSVAEFLATTDMPMCRRERLLTGNYRNDRERPEMADCGPMECQFKQIGSGRFPAGTGRPVGPSR